MYDYDRRRTAKSFEDYESRLARLQLSFVGEVGEAVYEYVVTTHERLSHRAPWSEMSFFTSWDWGTPKAVGSGYMLRVWQKSPTVYPGDINPVINIEMAFGSGVEVAVSAGNKRFYSKTHKLDLSPSSLALYIGGAWEKLLTGTVDYGD